MANIFQGTEPPAWLQAIARPIDTQLTGQVLGTGLGALTRMLTERNPVTDAQGKPVLDESGKPKTEAPSFGQALGETRMSQQYGPLWKLKAQEAQTSVWNNVAQLEATHQRLKMQADEAKGRTSDLPKLNQYMQDLKSDLNAVPPVMESIWGQQQTEVLSRAAQAKDIRNQQLKLQERNAKDEIEKRNRVQEFDRRKLEIPDEYRIQLDDLEKTYGTRDASGDINGRARDLVNQGLIAAKKPLLFTPVQENVAAIRTEGQLKVEEVKQQHRMELEKMKDQAYSGRPQVVDVDGQKFVQWGRHPLKPLTGMTNAQKAQLSIDEANIKNIQAALVKNPEKPEEARSEESLTHQLLEAKLRFSKKWLKPIAAEPKAAQPTAPAAPAPSADSNDPLGLFK